MATVRLVVTTTKKLGPLVSEALFGAGSPAVTARKAQRKVARRTKA
jgi:hypothetical protein